MMKPIERLIFRINPSSYLLFNRLRRKVRRQYETEKQKHYRERKTADYLLISPTNCGRTWLRFLLGTILQNSYNVEQDNPHYLYAFSELNPYIPAIKAIHERYGQFGLYDDKKIIYLARDPRDAVVSRYHQHYRNNPKYRDVNDFVLNSSELEDYVRQYNDWKSNYQQTADFMLVRYEDMKTDIHHELKRIIDFLQLKVKPDAIEKAVEYSSFQKMQSLEIKGSLSHSAGVFSKPSQHDDRQINANSLKVRKGKVGGYKEELSSEAIAYGDKIVREQLDSFFGYS